MNKLNIGPFSLESGQYGKFVIERQAERVGVSLGEVEAAINLLVHVMSLSDMKVLPDKISVSPFQADFNGNRTIHFRRKDDPSKGVPFKFSEGEIFVEALKAGQARCSDARKFKGGINASFAPFKGRDVPEEGR